MLLLLGVRFVLRTELYSKVAIPYSSGMLLLPNGVPSIDRALLGVAIPYSSGMLLLRMCATSPSGIRSVAIPYSSGMLLLRPWS